MTAFQDWLAAAAARRRELGLVRSTPVIHPADPMLDLAGNDCLGLRTHPPSSRGQWRRRRHTGVARERRGW